MNAWLYLLILSNSVVIYLLYSQGIAVTKSIKAIMFVFRPGRNIDRVTLDSCTGWVKHVGKFYKSKTYEFVLDMQLSKGDVEIILLDRKKRELMKLNQQSLTGKIDLGNH